MRHCNSVFSAEDVWFLCDRENETQRKLYIASCPICQKEIAVYLCYNNLKNCVFEKYYYSGGARKIKDKLNKDISGTMLGFRKKYKMPFGFKFGVNKEIRRNGKIIGINQYASDFYGNKVLVKKICYLENVISDNSNLYQQNYR